MAHFEALFSHLEPGIFNSAFEVTDSKRVALQSFERCFGVKTGSVGAFPPDCLATRGTEQAFKALRIKYLQLRRVFRSLSIRDGAVDWTMKQYCLYCVYGV